MEDALAHLEKAIGHLRHFLHCILEHLLSILMNVMHFFIDGFVGRWIQAASPGHVKVLSAHAFDLRAAKAQFTERVRETKRKLLEFLIEAKRAGKTVVGYGAPGKGNTLLNYCGIRTDFIDYTVDRSPHKQGKFLPGSRIPIVAPERIAQEQPDYILVLPWNLLSEVTQQLSSAKAWGARFVVAVPELSIQ